MPDSILKRLEKYRVMRVIPADHKCYATFESYSNGMCSYAVLTKVEILQLVTELLQLVSDLKE